MPPGGIAWLGSCFSAQEISLQSLWTCQISCSHLEQINGASLSPLSVSAMLPTHMQRGKSHLPLLTQQGCKSYKQFLFCVCPVCVVGRIGSAWLMFCQQSKNLPCIRNRVISVCWGLITSSPRIAKLDYSLALSFLALLYSFKLSASKGLYYSPSIVWQN